MPRTERTAYPSTHHAAGEECSSTSEGRYVRVYEDELIHPSHADGLVRKGDPCLTTGLAMVGVAMQSASSTDDVISLDTEGIWWLTVSADYGDIHVGTLLFINSTTATLSDNPVNLIPFGHALAPVSNEDTELIAVKVHACMPLWYVIAP